MFLVSIVIVWIMLMILASWTNFILIILEWTLHSSDWVRRLFGVGVYLISFSQIYEKDLCLLRRMYWYETFHCRIILATAPFRHISCCFKRIVTCILSCPFFSCEVVGKSLANEKHASYWLYGVVLMFVIIIYRSGRRRGRGKLYSYGHQMRFSSGYRSWLGKLWLTCNH